jgi:hypothetical protein
LALGPHRHKINSDNIEEAKARAAGEDIIEAE